MGNSSCVQSLNCNKLDQTSFDAEHTVERSIREAPKAIRLPKLSSSIEKILNWKANDLIQYVQRESEMKVVRFSDEIYEGQVNAMNLPHGLGKMYKSDGSLFIGKFDYGRAQGQGLYILSDGSYFEGHIENNVATCQKGVFHCKEYTYTGGFKDNHFEGQGQEVAENYVYKGTYQNGVRHCGELKWWIQPGEDNEYCFYGKFDSQGYFTEEGILKEPTGKYKGNFLQGKKHGEGIYRFNNNIIYEGNYYKGMKEGQGKVSCISNGEIIYQGNWKQNLPSGQGYRFDERGNKEKTYYIDGINVLALKNPQSLVPSDQKK